MAVETPRKPLPKPADESTKKFDPFRPEMPRIPGVSGPQFQGSQPPSSSRNRANPGRFSKLAGMAIAALLIAVVIAWLIKRDPRQVIETQPGEPAISPLGTVPAPQEAIPLPPASNDGVQVATTEELAKPWSAKKFIFAKPITRESVNAIVIRLPGGDLWAIALQEPYGRCELDYVTDLSLLASHYQYRASHPMVANPCSNTIYDPLKLASLGGNVWTRGEIVQGGGLRPPLSIEVKTSGHFIVADRME